MADTFYASPIKSTYSPYSDTTKIYEDVYSPLTPENRRDLRTLATLEAYARYGYNPAVSLYSTAGITSVMRPYGYYDGIGDNPVARDEIGKDLRYRFLDKWLYKNNQNILRMLKVKDGSVYVLSPEEAEKNDISKDPDRDMRTKSDYIANNILTRSKNMKILLALCQKNPHIKFYDLPYNHSSVERAQAKYVKKHLLKQR
jgi:hypothetical protein